MAKETTGERVFKMGSMVVAVFVFVLLYVIGQKSQTKVQLNMQMRLDITRSRYQQCQNEIIMLQGDLGEAKVRHETEINFAEQEHKALQEENDLLIDDNQNLRQDNLQLQERMDELKDELDEKDWVADDEVEELEELTHLDNSGLKAVFEDATYLGGVNKDSLIEKLLAELRSQGKELSTCRDDRVQKEAEAAQKAEQDRQAQEEAANKALAEADAKAAAAALAAADAPKPITAAAVSNKAALAAALGQGEALAGEAEHPG